MNSQPASPALIIEICPKEPRASMCLANGAEVHTDPEVLAHVLDCARGGDCEPACEYVRRVLGVDVRIVAPRNVLPDGSGEYENRQATPEEITATCRAIYFDSDSDFEDQDNAVRYLIWDAAANVEREPAL